MTPDQEVNVSVRLAVLEMILKHRSFNDNGHLRSRSEIVGEAKHYEEEYIKGGK